MHVPEHFLYTRSEKRTSLAFRRDIFGDGVFTADDEKRKSVFLLSFYCEEKRILVLSFIVKICAFLVFLGAMLKSGRERGPRYVDFGFQVSPCRSSTNELHPESTALDYEKLGRHSVVHLAQFYLLCFPFSKNTSPVHLISNSSRKRPMAGGVSVMVSSREIQR